MPISRAQFNTGLDDEQIAILRFLRQHEGEAFTLDEIWAGIGNRSSQPTGTGSDLGLALLSVAATLVFSGTIDRLVREGLVVARRIRGDRYYAINPEIA